MTLAAEQAVAASGPFSLSWLLIVLPLASGIALLLLGKRADKWGHLLGCASVIAAFALGLWMFISLTNTADKAQSLDMFTWVLSGDLKIEAGLLFDPLSSVFVLLITGVGSLIHIYSIGYMSHDEGRRRFFAYLNIFVASMLLLVLGNSFVALYFGWEGVGVASYLLIAFWQYKKAAATAAKKAFIMNRVGDVGLALAIFLMWSHLGTTSYAEVFGGIETLNGAVVTTIALLLLLGACGKSGQVPLQAWLPDAMEGPTPVSALIHAATMVTAGVYLIARANPIFDASESAQLVVTVVGAVTLLYGCIAGCAYDDIKKVLAYSTVSQIGYMFLAVGLGPGVYAIAIIHLLAHGFFKAGLFLGAGSVMHAMNDEVDMRKFGGLWKYMRITFVTFGLGYLALIGFPFLSGFYSKDPIIEMAFAQGGVKGWIFGLTTAIGAGLTAFYMTRLMLMTFFGKKRWDEGVHPHESPPTMTIPMIILAFGSLAGGYLLVNVFDVAAWLTPSVGEPVELEAAMEASPIPTGIVIALTMGLIALGIVLAWLFVGRKDVPRTAPAKVSPVVAAARANLYGDRFNETVFEKPGLALTRASLWLEDRGVDGAVQGLSGGLIAGSGRLRRTQNGAVRSYALSMLGGVVLVIIALLAVRFA
ncbi:NADH-quinone oxidoreductase subunit L [Epidermidibacterium keratini]|uniref:NADH-quinone oxidoreductase subunit L n=1 Tax=Epidermidibacterium keratini TaxID=1891644 RepID=A0A7L4YU90_9ACTN|nr:NADH-quinone oxidoreductase subunit L [Epidermidibacterium keratini]